MKYKEYAIKHDGKFLHDEEPSWGTRQVALFTMEEAKEHVKGWELTECPNDQKPRIELYEREVEVRATPWRKSKKEKKV